MDQQHPQTSQTSYDPNHLLDMLIEKLNLKNDAALSRTLEVAPPVISKIRHRRLPVGASMRDTRKGQGWCGCRELVFDPLAFSRLSLDEANAVFLAPVAHQVAQLTDWQVRYLVHAYQHLFWKNRQIIGGRKNNRRIITNTCLFNIGDTHGPQSKPKRSTT